MKTLRRTLVLTVLPALLAFGQGPGRAGGGMGGGDATTMLQRRIEFLTSALSLTDSQKASATKILTDAHVAAQTARASMETNQTALKAAVKKNDIGTIDQLSTAIGTVHGQVLSIESKAQAAFYTLLTPEQQTKYDSLRGGGAGRGAGMSHSSGRL